MPRTLRRATATLAAVLLLPAGPGGPDARAQDAAAAPSVAAPVGVVFNGHWPIPRWS